MPLTDNNEGPVCHVTPLDPNAPDGVVYFDIYIDPDDSPIYSGREALNFVRIFLLGFNIGRGCQVRIVNVEPKRGC